MHIRRLLVDRPEAGKDDKKVEVMTRKRKFGGVTIALGAALGAVLGVITGQMGVWLAVGLAIGVALGVSMRPKQPDCPQCAAMHRVHSTMERNENG